MKKLFGLLLFIVLAFHSACIEEYSVDMAPVEMQALAEKNPDKFQNCINFIFIFV